MKKKVLAIIIAAMSCAGTIPASVIPITGMAEKAVVEQAAEDKSLVIYSQSSDDPAEQRVSYELVSLPDKLEYKLGEQIDITGLQIEVAIGDEKPVIYAYPDIAFAHDSNTPKAPAVLLISDFRGDKAGTYKVEVADADNVSFNVKVVDDTVTTGTVTVTTQTAVTTTTTAAVSKSEEASGIKGDANCDGTVDMADAVMIMQAFANPNKYGINGTAEHHLTEQGKINGDMDGDGLTVGDAQAVQKKLLGIDGNDNENIIKDCPFSEFLNNDYTLEFPNLEFTAPMREKVTELFNSQESWKTTNNYNRFLHTRDGSAWSPFARGIILTTDNSALCICYDNVIEYAVFDDWVYDKTFYECDSLSLINSIAEIMESEFKDNGVDFDEDITGCRMMLSPDEDPEAEPSNIQKTLIELCMKGSSWTEKKATGTIGIQDGSVIFNKGTASYVCDNPKFSEDIRYIMNRYEYPDLKAVITIRDKDYGIVVSNYENNIPLEEFIYNDFYPLLMSYDENNSSVESTNSYSIDISYRTGYTDLRTEGYSMGSNGCAGRVDYVNDPIRGHWPAGCMNYSIDFSAFEAKLNEFLKQNITKNTDDPEQYAEDICAPTPHVIICYDDDYRNNDDSEKTIATCITHDNNKLDEFVTGTFESMLRPEGDEQYGGSNYRGYSLYRIYRANNNRITRDGYFIGENGNVALCSYIYENNEWVPSGCENYQFDFAKFEELLNEFLKTAKLPEE